MRKNPMFLSIIAFAVLAAACSKGERTTTTPSAQNVEYGQAYQAPADEDTIFEDAWEGFIEAGDEAGEAGLWVFERGKDGAIIVGRTTKNVAGTVAKKSDDATMVTAVKARLAAAKGIDSDEIDVDADAGDISLHGHVKSRQEAARVVNVALNTRGVDRVTSYLTW